MIIGDSGDAALSNDGKLMIVYFDSPNLEEETIFTIYNVEDILPTEIKTFKLTYYRSTGLSFSDDNSKIKLPYSDPAYYDMIKDEVVFFDGDVEDDYRKNGLFYDGFFLYRDSEFHLKSFNPYTNNISTLAEIRGGIIEIGKYHCVLAQGRSLLVFNKEKLLNNLDVDFTEQEFPFSIKRNTILVKQNYLVNIYDQEGIQLNIPNKNNIINRNDLPPGLWFISIEGENYHKVIKLFEEN